MWKPTYDGGEDSFSKQKTTLNNFGGIGSSMDRNGHGESVLSSNHMIPNEPNKLDIPSFDPKSSYNYDENMNLSALDAREKDNGNIFNWTDQGSAFFDNGTDNGMEIDEGLFEGLGIKGSSSFNKSINHESRFNKLFSVRNEADYSFPQDEIDNPFLPDDSLKSDAIYGDTSNQQAEEPYNDTDIFMQSALHQNFHTPTKPFVPPGYNTTPSSWGPVKKPPAEYHTNNYKISVARNLYRDLDDINRSSSYETYSADSTPISSPTSTTARSAFPSHAYGGGGNAGAVSTPLSWSANSSKASSPLVYKPGSFFQPASSYSTYPTSADNTPVNLDEPLEPNYNINNRYSESSSYREKVTRPNEELDSEDFYSEQYRLKNKEKILQSMMAAKLGNRPGSNTVTTKSMFSSYTHTPSTSQYSHEVTRLPNIHKPSESGSSHSAMGWSIQPPQPSYQNQVISLQQPPPVLTTRNMNMPMPMPVPSSQYVMIPGVGIVLVPNTNTAAPPMRPMMYNMAPSSTLPVYGVTKPPDKMPPRESADGYIYQIQFKHSQQCYLLGPSAPRHIRIGDFVKVEADRGEDLGVVCNKIAATEFKEEKPTAGYRGRGLTCELGDCKRINRLATEEERALLPAKAMEEMQVLQVCQEKVYLHFMLPMRVVDAEYQFDRHKLTIFFEADRRIDFRELVRDLFALYKTRIWMQQMDASFVPDERAARALATGDTLPSSASTSPTGMGSSGGGTGSGSTTYYPTTPVSQGSLLRHRMPTLSTRGGGVGVGGGIMTATSGSGSSGSVSSGGAGYMGGGGAGGVGRSNDMTEVEVVNQLNRIWSADY